MLRYGGCPAPNLMAIGVDMVGREGAGDKENPLREDIRLLGRLLGDAVREREGDEVFSTVERIRQISVRLVR